MGGFTALPLYDSTHNVWQQQPSATTVYTAVAAYSLMTPNTPGDGSQQWPVREWVSTFTGSAVITLSVQLQQPKDMTGYSNDGLVARVFRNRVEQPILKTLGAQSGTLGTGIAVGPAVGSAGDFSLKTGTLTLALTAGDCLDFAIDPNTTANYDNVWFFVTISSTVSRVTVDFGAAQQVKSASGFLHGIAEGNPPLSSPPETTIDPLKPMIWRIPAIRALYDLVRGFAPDIPIHLVLSDLYLAEHPFPADPSLWVGPWADLPGFALWVKAKAAPFSGATNIYFDISH